MVQIGDFETKILFHPLFIQDQKGILMDKNQHSTFNDPKKPLIELA